jgi:hypothetical protein
VKRHLVAYDVADNPTDGRRKRLREKIAELYPDGFDHVELSVYLVATTKTASQVYDDLVVVLWPEDRLLVATLTGAAAWKQAEGLQKWFDLAR